MLKGIGVMAEPVEKMQEWTHDSDVLRELVQRGIDSGPLVPIDFEEVRRKGREMARKMQANE